MKQRFSQSTVQSTQNHNTLTFASSDSFHLCLMVKMIYRSMVQYWINLNLVRLLCCVFVWIALMMIDIHNGMMSRKKRVRSLSLPSLSLTHTHTHTLSLSAVETSNHRHPTRSNTWTATWNFQSTNKLVSLPRRSSLARSTTATPNVHSTDCTQQGEFLTNIWS
jgi:hypothetical protein